MTYSEDEVREAAGLPPMNAEVNNAYDATARLPKGTVEPETNRGVAAPNFAQENNRYLATAAATEDLKKDAEIKKNNQNTIPAFESAKKLYNDLPEEAHTFIPSAAGVAAGMVGRSFLPQEKVYGTSQYQAKQASNAADIRGADTAARDARKADLTANNATADYQTRAGTLADQHAEFQKANTAAQEALETARQNHRYAQTLDPAEEFARRRGLGLGNSSAPIENLPRGGSGTFNYAEKFGASPSEAMQVPSASVMQQSNIPNQAKAFGEIPMEFQPRKGSELILGPEGAAANAERMAQQGYSSAESANMQKQIAAEIARHKAEMQFQFENATKAADESRKAAASSAKELKGHSATPAVSPAQSAARTTTGEALAEAQRAAKAAAPGFGSKFASLFGKAIPFVGGALSPLEMMQAKEDYEKGNYGRAITHGLGAAGALAQMSGIPPLMAAGSLAQLPALGLGTYDLYNEYNKPSAPQMPPR
jgi:hypothetical protein